MRSCGGRRTTTNITVVFGDDGGVDLGRSDFNGNDVPEGREG